jgi:hypothetical protein
MKRLFLVVASLLFVSCGTPHYTILGADGWGWNASIVTVLSDIEINALKVRHVRLENGGCKGGFKDHLELSGPIGPDSSEVVDRVLQKVPRCDNSTGNGWTVPIVYLNSPGGQLKHGFQLGQTLRKYQAQAVITKGQQCASSCAIAFLGARFRSIEHDGRLLFHSPYVSSATGIACMSKEEGQDMRSYMVTLLSG